MNSFFKISALCLSLLFFSCELLPIDGKGGGKKDEKDKENPFETEFTQVSSTVLTDGGSPEISAYDSITQQVFSTNPANNTVEVIDISDVENPQYASSIDISQFGANLNSVSVNKGKLAIAIEGADSSINKGRVVIFNTEDLTTPILNLEAGFLPDMVTFSPNGKYALVANEGEPNDENIEDPEGTISIVDIENNSVFNLNFTEFNDDEEALEAQGFRVFGEKAGNPNNLSTDVEPEFITVSADSKTAYVALQENNGIAVVDIESKKITSILPLGTKDFSAPQNTFDVSDEDGTIQLNNWNVKSFYMPDAIEFFSIDGTDYLITANEGDARDYDGFSEEVRVDDLILDETAYPDAATLQLEENLGRLKTTTANGDLDGDGDVDQIFAYGGRSFTIWTTDGSMVYDSANFLTEKTIELGTYPDDRSDDKGTEPESVTTLKVGKYMYAFVGLERSGDVFVYNITNPAAPEFLQSLANTSPEGLLAVSAKDSPNGKELLIVSNEFPENAALVIYSK